MPMVVNSETATLWNFANVNVFKSWHNDLHSQLGMFLSQLITSKVNDYIVRDRLGLHKSMRNFVAWAGHETNCFIIIIIVLRLL